MTFKVLLLLVLLLAVVRTDEITNKTVSLASRQFDDFFGSPFVSYGLAQRQPMHSGNSVDPWASPLPNPSKVNTAQQQSEPVGQQQQSEPVGQQQQSEPVGQQQQLVSTTISSTDKRPMPIKNNYKLIVDCQDEDMTVRVEFERPFHGVVYSKGYFNKPECIYVHGDNRSTIFNFTIGYNSCGSYNRKAKAPVSETTTVVSTTSTQAPTTTTEVQTTSPINFSQSYDVPATTTVVVPVPPRNSYTPYTPQFNQIYASQPQQQQQQQPQQQQQQQQQPLINQNQLYQPTGLYQPQQQSYLQPSMNAYATNGLSQIPSNLLPTGMIGYNQQQVPMYAQGYPAQQVMMYPQGQMNNVLNPLNNLGLYGNYGRQGRAMEEDVPTVDMQWVENTLVIQQDGNVQDAMDDAKSLQCEWRERYNKKIVTEGYRVEMADVVRASFPGDNVGAYMQIKAGLGPLAPEAKGVIRIGSPLTLMVGLTNSSNKFDLLVHTCYAKSSGATPSIQLVDENGCVLRDKYLGPFVPYSDSDGRFGQNKVVFAYFQAFKFPDSTEVDIECSVSICRNACPAQCFGRYKGEMGNKMSNWTISDKKKAAVPVEKVRQPTFGKPLNVSFSQGRIMEALERRLKAVNGAQQLDVKVESASPFMLNPPKFLQLRELSNETESDSVKTTTSTPLFLKKIKRQVIQDSSDVDLRKKLTVVYPSDTEGTKDQFLLVNPTERLMPIGALMTTTLPVELEAKSKIVKEDTFVVSSTTVATVATVATLVSSSTTTVASTTASESSSTSTTDSVDLGKFLLPSNQRMQIAVDSATEAPVVYALQNYYRNVCLPLIGLIGIGVVALLLILAALVCGACMCCKYRKQLKKARHTFSPIYSDPRPTATPVSRRLLTEF